LVVVRVTIVISGRGTNETVAKSLFGQPLFQSVSFRHICVALAAEAGLSPASPSQWLTPCSGHWILEVTGLFTIGRHFRLHFNGLGQVSVRPPGRSQARGENFMPKPMPMPVFVAVIHNK